MCDGVWVLFEGSELHSLWSSEDDVRDFMEENYLIESPEYYYTWIRIEE
jgi:hypothetical protein